jgi:murein L,D-transpeptidase YafK
MDLIKKRQAKNVRARNGFTVLFVGYVLVAVLTSVPIQTIKYPDLADRAAPSDSLQMEDLSAVQTLTLAGDRSTALPQWWKQHQQVANLQRKWWQEHARTARFEKKWWQSHQRVAQQQETWWQDHQGVSVRKTGQIQRQIAHLNISKAVSRSKSVIKNRLADKSSAMSGGLSSPKPSSSPKGPLKLVRAVPVSQPKSVVVATKVVAEKSVKALPEAVLQAVKETLQKPRTGSDWKARIKQASLLPAGISSTGITARKISYHGYAELLPAVITSAFPRFKKHRLKKQTINYCMDGKIAGWSGIELLQKHKERIEQSSIRFSDVSTGLVNRLVAKGFKPGSSVFLRIFKDRSELEVWLKKDDRYELYRTHKICRWSGSFGPKLYEGDKQSPEGFYLVNRQLFNRPSWKWKGSFSIGYPNAYDKLHGRTGSLILVHGGCTSSGCFAMTDPVIQEVRELARLARENGQQKFSVHVYPFKLSSANLEKYKHSPWLDFWNNLKEGYDLFEKTRLPPTVRVCHKRYVFAQSGVERSGAGWSGKGCYGLEAFIPGWKPASRYARKGSRRRVRSSSRRGARCNPRRASCRKWVALKRKKARRQRRKSGKRIRVARNAAAKRRSPLRGARSIGRKRKR